MGEGGHDAPDRLRARSADPRTGEWAEGAVAGRGRVRAYAPVVAAGAALSLVPAFAGGSRYLMSLAVTMLVFACYAIAFNVVFGCTRQLFLCVGALAGVSAYLSAVVADERGWPMWAAIGLGTAASATLGATFSWVAVRRRLDVIFVGIVTLAFSLVFANVAQGLRTVTGGETGRIVVTGDGTLLRDHQTAYAMFLALTMAFLVVFRLVQRSHLGWAFRALSDDDVAAQLAGIDVARYRIAAGAIGSAMLGLTGALFVHHDGFISPTVFGFAHVDVRTIVVLAFGGIGSLLGPIVGAAALSVVDELLRPLGQLRLAVYGGLMLVLFLGVRQGVVPGVMGLVRRLRARP